MDKSLPTRWKIEEAIKLFNENKGNISKTARETGIERLTLRKILLAEGVLEKNEMEEKIEKMLENGKTKEEIMEELNISSKVFWVHSPHEKGYYDGVTKSSKKSMNYRERIQATKLRLEKKKKEIQNLGYECMLGVNLTIDDVERNKAFSKFLSPSLSLVDDIASININDYSCCLNSEEDKDRADEGCTSSTSHFAALNDDIPGLDISDEAINRGAKLIKDIDAESKAKRGFCLFFELIFDENSDALPNSIFKYGKAYQGITRTCICPADMDLLSLHYAIMALFNFQNLHYHYFLFPDDLNSLITKNSFYEWIKALYSIYRFPISSGDYITFTNDDVEFNNLNNANHKISVKSYMKKKAYGPYNKAQLPFETYNTTKERLEELIKNWPYTGINKLPAHVSLNDVQSLFKTPLQQLTETLTVEKVFNMSNSIDYIYDPLGSNWKIRISHLSSNDVATTLNKPYCISLDGLSPFEDLKNGALGYSKFLTDIHKTTADISKSYDSSSETRELKDYIRDSHGIISERIKRARLLGWSERRESISRIL